MDYLIFGLIPMNIFHLLSCDILIKSIHLGIEYSVNSATYCIFCTKDSLKVHLGVYAI